MDLFLDQSSARVNKVPDDKKKTGKSSSGSKNAKVCHGVPPTMVVESSRS